MAAIRSRSSNPARSCNIWLKSQDASCLRTAARASRRCNGCFGRWAEIGRATSELQSLMRISYAVFCLKKKKTERQLTTDNKTIDNQNTIQHTAMTIL